MVSYHLNIELSFANIINGFVIKLKNDMSVFQKRESWKDGFVEFNRVGDLKRWINIESKFVFFDNRLKFLSSNNLFSDSEVSS